MKSFIFHKKTLLTRAGGALIALTLVLGQVFSGPSTALAASILSDSFGTSNSSVVTGWIEENPAEILGSSSGVDITRTGSAADKFVKLGANIQGEHHSQSVKNGWICKLIPAAGYTNLSISYYWKGDSDAEATDKGVVEYRTNGNCSSQGGWTTIDTENTNTNTASWSALENHALLISDTSFYLRFRNDASKANKDDSVTSEFFRIDGVSVEGTLIPTDVCGNISGVQTEAPKGYSIEYRQDQSQCIPDKVNVTVCKKDDEGNFLPGWTINLDWNSDVNNHWSAVTGQDGCAYFNGIHSNDYMVSEVNQTNWSLVSLPNETGHIQAFSEQNGPYYVVNRYTPPTPTTATVVATKIVCDAEQYLPNWGKNEVDRSISATTASDFVAASNGKCHFQAGWQFEWSPEYVDETMDNAHDGGPKWTDFSSLTDTNGVATTTVTTESGVVWVREQMQDGYVPFSGDHDGNDGWDEVSAEMYCDADVINYDNIDYISEPKAGSTYHCVAFNVLATPAPACVPGENLLKNGGFETPDVSSGGYGIFPQGTTGLEWLVDWVNDAQTNGIKGLEIQDHAAGDPAEGAQLAELDGDHPVKIWQEVPTIPGKEYKLTFNYSPRAGRTASDNSLKVKIDGSDLAGSLFATDGSANTNTAWEPIIRTFTATGTTTKVEFYDNGDDTSYGGYLDDVKLSCVGDPTPTCDEGTSWNAELKQCVPNDTTSDVTMCKIDANGTKLSGWTLMLLKNKVDTVTVPSNDADGVESNVSLNGNVPYVAIANGTWLNDRGEQNLVDAEYSTVNGWTTAMDGYTGYGADILELKINNTLGAWGPFNSLHTYARSFTMASVGKAILGIEDSYHADNKGDLSVDIYEGYSGITGDNGCVTFTDVPFGSYTVSELNQAGWTPVNADQTKAINQPTQEITVENHFDFCPDKEGVQSSSQECGGGEETPTYACSDDRDNDEDGLVDEADPACHSDHDVNNQESYTPNANSEVYEGAQCSDGKENDSDNLVDSNDPGCHTDGNATDGDDTYNPDDNDESNGSSRSGSIPNGGGSVLGAFIGPAVLGENMCGEYITDYIKLGAKNDPANVSRLQTFLNEYLGLSLKVDGYYGPATFEAVKQFQIKEAGEVLNPWVGVTLKDKIATGWVYKTTRRWINMIKCPELNIPQFEKSELIVR